jgi:hypothetical protein
VYGILAPLALFPLATDAHAPHTQRSAGRGVEGSGGHGSALKYRVVGSSELEQVSRKIGSVYNRQPFETVGGNPDYHR